MAIIGFVLLLFTAGYLACCLIASLKMPSWSQRGATSWVQRFRFLTAKFRLDTWFFGIIVPLRGLFFSLVIVFTTDLPPAQVAFGSIILLTYGALQIRCWPWKAEAINIAATSRNLARLVVVSYPRPSCQAFFPCQDMFSNVCLLLLLATSVGEGSYEGFTQAFALAILIVLGFFLLVCWASIFASALHRYVFKGDGKMWIDGRAHDSDQVSTALNLGTRAAFCGMPSHVNPLCFAPRMPLAVSGQHVQKSFLGWDRKNLTEN